MMPNDATARDFLMDAIFALGANFFVQGKYEKAQIIFDGLMALDPEHSTPAIAYGESLLMGGQIDRALDHFLMLSKKFDLDPRALLGAAKACILLGKNDEARKLLEPIVENEIPAPSQIALEAKSILTVMQDNEKSRIS